MEQDLDFSLARVQYEADGTTSSYSIPFPYIDRDDIKVSIDGTGTDDFQFTDASTINLDETPDSGAIIDIVRETERSDLLVQFSDGSTLLETDLMLMAQQTFYIAQEAFDQTGATLGVTEDGSYTANGRRISTLGYPSEYDDASTKSYVDDIFAQGENAYEQANIATDAADTAVGARDAAEAAEATTLNYRNTTEQHKIDAAASASAASTSETNAADSESNAATSEANAVSSADDAEAWAAGVNMPSIEGSALKILRSKADESGYEHIEQPYTQTEADGLLDIHTAEEGGIHGIPANERAIHSEELRAAVSTATTTAEAVSMTGKGAIVESGSTPDGYYVRWDNGEQVCWDTINMGDATEFGAGTLDNIYRAAPVSILFPSMFIIPPAVSSSAFSPNGNNGADRFVVASAREVTELEIPNLQASRGTDFIDDVFVNWIAWGFYK